MYKQNGHGGDKRLIALAVKNYLLIAYNKT